MPNQTEPTALWRLAPGVTFLTEDCRQGKVVRQDGTNTIVQYGNDPETSEECTTMVYIAT